MSRRKITRREWCARCGDPMPVDGRCDCAGDPDRDHTSHESRMLHEVPVRRRSAMDDGEAGAGEIDELWI